jgi:hypothetical protein
MKFVGGNQFLDVVSALSKLVLVHRDVFDAKSLRFGKVRYELLQFSLLNTARVVSVELIEPSFKIG